MSSRTIERHLRITPYKRNKQDWMEDALEQARQLVEGPAITEQLYCGICDSMTEHSLGKYWGCIDADLYLCMCGNSKIVYR